MKFAVLIGCEPQAPFRIRGYIQQTRFSAQIAQRQLKNLQRVLRRHKNGQRALDLFHALEEARITEPVRCFVNLGGMHYRFVCGRPVGLALQIADVKVGSPIVFNYVLE